MRSQRWRWRHAVTGLGGRRPRRRQRRYPNQASVTSPETTIRKIPALTHFPLPMSAPVSRAITATKTGTAISKVIRVRPADIAIRAVGTFLTVRSDEHPSDLQSQSILVCRLLLV